MKKSNLALAAAIGLVMGTVAPAISAPGVTGNGNANTTVDFQLSLACDNNGSEVGFGANGSSSGTTNLEAKLAFANPSVVWDESDNQWEKKSGNGAWVKVNEGSELTTIPLTLSQGNVKKNTSNRGMGNPHVYFFDASAGVSGSWTYLGRCNSPTDPMKTVKFKNANFSLTGNVNGQGNGPCLTNAKSSSMAFSSKFTPGPANMGASALLVYSNKKGIEPLLNGDSWYKNPVPAGSTSVQKNAGNGTFNTRVDLAVGFTDEEISASFPARNRQAAGIGGNPNVWLQAGDSEFIKLGRCNTLTN